MEIFKFIVDVVSLIANLLTTVASAIAIYLFVKKKRELSDAFDLLLNWSFQATLLDLRGKLDRLSEYNANDMMDVPEIRNIFHELAGQIRGNIRLQRAAPELASRLEAFAGEAQLTEHAKRSIVAEVGEILRNVQLNTIPHEAGDRHE